MPRTTRLLVPSLHCPTCVSYLTDLLAPLSLSNLHIALLTRTVAFDTPAPARSTIRNVVKTLRQAGYEVEDPDKSSVDKVKSKAAGKAGDWFGWEWLSSSRKAESEEERKRRHVEHCAACQEHEKETQQPHSSSSPFSPSSSGMSSPRPRPLEIIVSPKPPQRLVETTLSIDGMTCSSCTSSIYAALISEPAVVSVSVNLISNSATVVHDASALSIEQVVELVDDLGYGAEVVRSKALDEGGGDKDKPVDGGRVRSTFSVDGMTCASCTHTITDALKDLPSVSGLAISLTSNSCVLEHDPAVLTTDQIIEAVEDLGYGANLVRSEGVGGVEEKKKSDAEEKTVREVTLRIDGMDCVDDAERITSALARLPIQILQPPTPSRPLLTISYTPSRSLTIRTLLSSLPTPLTSTLHTPPSLSSLSRHLQQRELHHILLLFSLSLLFAIPTFVIGVLGMLLLAPSTALHTWSMAPAPAWGGANRGTVALFALATPVYFVLAARVFHVRALKSLRSSVRRRPFRLAHLMSFGNMDTLVSLSITVAYFASVGMLARDVALGAGNGVGATYFDSVVFLVFFILMGRAVEARARVMTGDAIAMLGQLKPETADLVVSNDDSGNANLQDDKLLAPESRSSDVTEIKGDSPARFRTVTIPVSQLDFSDHILLRPGSLPPADGVLVSGSTSFDESSLTGESIPVPKQPGDAIYTGTTNLTAACIVEVRALGEGTMLERIVRAVGDAQGRKAPVEMLADRITAVFVPLIIWLALLVLIIWLAVSLSGAVPYSYLSASDLGGSGGGATADSPGNRVFFSFEFAIAVLVVACPCGIGLAAPTAQAVGAGMAARMGVLAQGGGEAFQLATEVDTVVFDKTGTLTVGEAKVEDAEFVDGEEKSWVRGAVRALEERSSHPLAAALKEYCADAADGAEVLTSEEVAGRGAKGTVAVRGRTFDLVIGNEAFMRESGAAFPAGASRHDSIQGWKLAGKSVVLVATRPAQDASSVGSSTPAPYTISALFSISDSPRPDSASSIATLKSTGKDVWMLSGDNETTARAIAKRVGIEETHVIAGVLPHEKADRIRGLQAGGRRGARRVGWAAGWMERVGMREQGRGDEKAVVLFCGDGLNDSAAIAAADVGVALGHGSQITVAAADFIILNSSLSTLPALLHLSSRVYRRQKQNFGWALIYNCAALPLAAGVFYPAGHTRLPPVWSALAMALSSVSVVTSSLALRWGI